MVATFIKGRIIKCLVHLLNVYILTRQLLLMNGLKVPCAPLTNDHQKMIHCITTPPPFHKSQNHTDVELEGTSIGQIVQSPALSRVIPIQSILYKSIA